MKKQYLYLIGAAVLFWWLKNKPKFKLDKNKKLPGQRANIMQASAESLPNFTIDTTTDRQQYKEDQKLCK